MNNNTFENLNTEFKDMAKWLYSLNAYEFTIIATLIGIIISKDLTINQQNSIGNFFEQVGQTMLLIAAQNTTVKHNIKRNSSISNAPLDGTENEIAKLKAEVIQLRKDSLNNNNI